MLSATMVQALRTRNVRSLAAAAAQCSAEASDYGRCAVADFTTLGKDKCLKEFLKLEQCCAKVIAKTKSK
ncbi:hypothetical protein XA68_11520 [Ophiocordyceps unilateralis]|uniref:IMS import disulfide relay-system CHCH-CHCH-like Cx9C domain-containing protein n=1 Tax=Ophiocordyceps unilateralis TaxID=268505 RepID=A0A2A9NZ99_OPHUN|nr:hypothetical protein XA68_11520 [Ophiocordyceps unilateralis]